MGSWGTGLYSDDLAADLREDFKDAAGDGLDAAAILDRLAREHAASVEDLDDGPTFWLVVADMGWKLGRLDERARRQALAIIDSGRDLERWDERGDRAKRAALLERLREQLNTPPKPLKRVPHRIPAATDWEVGEVFALRLQSDRLTLLRVVGYHEDRGGRFPQCELLDWTGGAIPTAAEIDRLPIRRPLAHMPGEFMLPAPRKKADQARLTRTGHISTPSRTRASMGVLLWSHLDQLLLQQFGIE